MSRLLCGSCIGCRSQREYSTSCACLCTRCSSGKLLITLPACWRPPLTLLHGRRCVHRVTVTRSYQERVGRSVTGLSLLPHPVLGIDCQPTWNKLKSFLFHVAYTENTVRTLQCAIGLIVEGRTTSRCCYCYYNNEIQKKIESAHYFDFRFLVTVHCKKLNCRRETTRCYVSLNISLVTQDHSRSLEVAPFESLATDSY